MSAKAVFAAVVAMFAARPQGADAIASHAPLERAHEDDGLVSPQSASRISAAFSRFQRFILGGGG
ncbi:MAG: hypothetical protein KJZ75_11410 [Hyphomonadaceae bacterium]|nr:hypothetical protein [Hyphomonadaceae bacterium]